MTDQTTVRRLVLHADDFGMNRAISDGILRGFRQGLLTSTSLLANAPDARRALQEWKILVAEQQAGHLPSAGVRESLDDLKTPFDLGVHLNLTQGRPLSGSRFPADLLDSAGRFPGVFALFDRLRKAGGKYREAIKDELERQLLLMQEFGVEPSHLNGHQYIEMMPEVSDVVVELVERFGLKSIRVAREDGLWRSTVLRGQFWKYPMACVKRIFCERFLARIKKLHAAHPDVFFGTSHAGEVNMRLLRRFLGIARTRRLVEVGLHPGEPPVPVSIDDVKSGWSDPLASSRPNELRMLISRELPEYLRSAGWRLGRLAST